MYRQAPAVLAEIGIGSAEELAYFGDFLIVASDGINTTKLQAFNKAGCAHSSVSLCLCPLDVLTC